MPQRKKGKRTRGEIKRQDTEKGSKEMIPYPYFKPTHKDIQLCGKPRSNEPVLNNGPYHFNGRNRARAEKSIKC